MGAVKGLLSTLEAATNENANEWQESILVRNSRGYNVGTTLFGLMARLDNEPAENLEYNWFERDPVRKTVFAAAAQTAGDTVLAIDDNAGSPQSWVPLLPPGTILMNDLTKEFVRIRITGSTNATIERAVGGSAAAISDNQNFTIVTLGKMEGATPVAAQYEDPTTLTNYIQTFNSAVEITNAFKGSVLRTDLDGPIVDRRIQALERIGRDIEFAYFLGQKKKYNVGGTQGASADTTVTQGFQYFTGGIYAALTAFTSASTTGATNIFDGSAATTPITAFNSWLSNVLPFGSDTKLAFCGPSAYAAISTYANTATNGYRIMQNETVFGMNIQVVNTPFGELSLTQHPLFREAQGLRDWMFIVDLPHLAQKVFEKLFLEPNIQANGADSYLEQYRAKLGLKLKFPQAFGVAYELTGLV